MKSFPETPHSEGTRHDVVMGSELYLINRVEEGKGSWYMYCINYGRFDDGKGRSELLSQKLGRSTQTSSPVRTQSLLSLMESSTDVRHPPSSGRHVSPSCHVHIGPRQAFIVRP